MLTVVLVGTCEQAKGSLLAVIHIPELRNTIAADQMIDFVRIGLLMQPLDHAIFD